MPKLQTTLFTAHLIATAANVGRVLVTRTPLAINYVEWMTFLKSAFSQMRWTIFEKESERLAHVQTTLDAGWDDLDKRLSAS